MEANRDEKYLYQVGYFSHVNLKWKFLLRWDVSLRWWGDVYEAMSNLIKTTLLFSFLRFSKYIWVPGDSGFLRLNVND